ncbi:Gfo/Idh/MocA family oxidoreductase [Haloparvum alkalitolerans]|uniref:D-xylose 1-dehydrogenase Gfo6 n=1 Tax=Haloparvum alkalitolerans TaxID=1042953 RepID=UPI003CE8E71F
MDLDALYDRFDERDWETPAEGTLRVAMVGLGGWTRNHAIPAVAAGDYCETTVLVSGHADKAESVAAELPGEPETLDYEAFHAGAASEAYDAAYVATPNALHLPHVRAAADLGKHVLCEKPLEASAERARALVDACEEAGVTLMTAYRLTADPAVRFARELVREGYVGEPGLVRGHMTQPVLDHGDADQWRLDPDLAGRGTSVTDLGIYPLSTARFVLDADPVRVSAAMSSEHSAFADVPDERASFRLEFPDGLVADCAASQNLQRSGSFRIVGTEGEIRFDPAFYGDPRRTLALQRGSTSTEFAFDAVDQMRAEFDYFGNRVLAGREPEADGAFGAADVATIEAVYDAAKRDAPVEL